MPLRSLKDLEHYVVSATDGDVGRVGDFLLDDEIWAVRYLVVTTGGFLSRHDVLVTPRAFEEVQWATERFVLNLSKGMVEESPSVDTHKPVSRQREEELHNYYGYPRYWDYAEVWGVGTSPALMAAEAPIDLPRPNMSEAGSDSHLRSAKEVRGYNIQASDDSIGHVDDFIVADDIWEIRYLVVDTSNWWLGKKVLIAPEWASRISWEEQNVYVDMTRAAIQASPQWDPSVMVNREYETRLYDHYRRPAYWGEGAVGRARERRSSTDSLEPPETR
ncbi:MAG TPA: PRC-barrel domain-containing protein [Polyangiaceae bacterium]